MLIGIGSTNPAKISAVEKAVAHAHEVLKISDAVEFRPVSVSSGVSVQPFSDKETQQGALNRATAVLETDAEIDRAFGLEGGVKKLEDGLYSTVWIAVVDRENRSGVVQGGGFRLPDRLAKGIFSGNEMGDVMDEISGSKNIKHREGMIGVMTGGVVTRVEAYEALARLAYGLYLGPSSLG